MSDKNVIWSPISKPLTQGLLIEIEISLVICSQRLLFGVTANKRNYCVSFQLFITLEGWREEKKGKVICSVNSDKLIIVVSTEIFSRGSSGDSGRSSRGFQTKICLLGNCCALAGRLKPSLWWCVWRPEVLGWGLEIWNPPRSAACALPAAALPLSSLLLQQRFGQSAGQDGGLNLWLCLHTLPQPGFPLRLLFWGSGVCTCTNRGWQILRNIFCAVWMLQGWVVWNPTSSDSEPFAAFPAALGLSSHFPSLLTRLLWTLSK